MRSLIGTKKWIGVAGLITVLAVAFGHAADQPAHAATPASFTVYGDARAAGWADWSWDSSVNFSATTAVYSGSKAISWKGNAAWAGLYLHSDTGVGSAPYVALAFALRSSQAGQAVSVVLEDVSDHPLGPVVMLAQYGGTPAPGTWTRYAIPLTALGGVNRVIGGIVIQDESGKAEPPMYVDEIALSAGVGTVATTTGTPTPRVVASPTALSPRITTPGSTPTPTARPPLSPPSTPGAYPWHTNIISTTFWVGELFNAGLSDGSQACSTYDGQWDLHFSGLATNALPATAAGCPGAYAGGCDGVWQGNACATETRTAATNYFPTHMTPRENPFYLDLPFDDLNDTTAFRQRCQVIPWAAQPAYSGRCSDAGFSYMKNRWVRIAGPNGHTCFGQIEDAGPSHDSLYHDAAYVFGNTDARPVQGQFNDAGLDVSPALNGCLGFADLNGENDHVSWQFVDDQDVPAGPWKLVVTSSGVTP